MRESSVSLATINEQPAEKPLYDINGFVQVHSVFHTIQGEGPFAGHPSVFVRLAGCNLQCPACDTEYTSSRQFMNRLDIDNKIRDLLPGNRRGYLIVLTGGEPFRQDFVPHVNYLIDNGYRVQIETNGTLFSACHGKMMMCDNLTIVCSPKTPLLSDRIRPYVKCLKYVVDAENIDTRDGLPVVTLGNTVGVARPWSWFDGDIYISPLDVGDPVRNKANVECVVDVCKRFGYILSLQLHKILELP